jgi:hypothetical protein
MIQAWTCISLKITHEETFGQDWLNAEDTTDKHISYM